MSILACYVSTSLYAEMKLSLYRKQNPFVMHDWHTRMSSKGELVAGGGFGGNDKIGF